MEMYLHSLTLLHLERPKLYTILAFLSAIGLRNKGCHNDLKHWNLSPCKCVIPDLMALEGSGYPFYGVKKGILSFQENLYSACVQIGMALNVSQPSL